MTLRTWALALAVPALLTAAPKTEADKPGSQDHPLFTRMPGFIINGYATADFGSEDFPLKSGKQVVEGRKTEIHYIIKKATTKPSPLEIVRNHTQAFLKAGGEVVWEKTTGGNAATMRMKKGPAETWAHVRAWGGGTLYTLSIVEKGQMEQKISSNALLDALNKDGRVALDIHFDTGKATIKTDSQIQMDEILGLLQANPDLKLSIEGHTDNTGTPEGNRKLSGDRAKSVMTTLVAKGITASRLQAKGFGQDKPVADNATEEGRAKNRRVELVKL